MSGARTSSMVGMAVAVLIIGAVASIGYYQFVVAPSQTGSSTTSAQVTCGASNCAHVSITPNAGTCIDPSNPCGFSAPTITVVVGVNNTVLWTSNDGSIHTVTGSGWGSGALNQGDTYQFTFTAAGTYQYHCAYHAGMKAQVIVKA